jgi:RNA polymerase sigma-70 factor (ECF subfamily)
MAQSVTGRDNAEDVAQDALLLAFKALPSIENPNKFAAWLGAITRNRARACLREEKSHRANTLGLDEVLLDHVEALSLPFVHESENDELKRALENVAADYALVLRMRFLDEMPHKRIAAFLGVPVSTVKWRIHKGKQYLREQLEQLRKSKGKKQIAKGKSERVNQGSGNR